MRGFSFIARLICLISGQWAAISFDRGFTVVTTTNAQMEFAYKILQRQIKDTTLASVTLSPARRKACTRVCQIALACPND